MLCVIPTSNALLFEFNQKLLLNTIKCVMCDHLVCEDLNLEYLKDKVWEVC